MTKFNYILDPLIGADIEVFLQNKDSGEIVSAEGLIQGTKIEPFRFDSSNHHFATSLDNVMAEFNIPPTNDKNLFVQYLNKSLNYINGYIPGYLTSVAIPSARLNPVYLETENAMMFGCDPDYNAWTGKENPRPEPNGNLRTAGGHLHVSYKNPNKETSLKLVKAFDISIGVASVIQEPKNERKTLYGKAGAYREKEYGCEYRSVSNYYLNSPTLMSWAFEAAHKAISLVNEGIIDSLNEDEAKDIQNAINFCDESLANKLIKKYDIKLAA